jgi:4'-phosphopantetheinyl transferase
MISILAVKNSHELDDGLYGAFFKLISEERKLRVKKFFRREDACRCILAEIIAKYCIVKKCKVRFDAISFKYGEHGKPYIETPEKIQFSISHSGAYVVCAIDKKQIGIDVERIHDVDMAIASRFFSAEECAEIFALQENSRKSKFFDFWTIKESYIKAIGKGLSCPLSSFTIGIGKEHISMKSGNLLPVMFFRQYDIDNHYKCAVCSSGSEFPEKIEIMTPEILWNSIRV